MVMKINQNYSQFYKGTESMKNYGSGEKKKDTLVKYEFNTTDEQGNKIMDKMSREETLQAMKIISAQYGDNVIVEFSGDGMAALVESRKGILDKQFLQEETEAKTAKQTALEQEIIHLDKKVNYLPEYSGVYGADKAVATAVENCSREEQAFVYDIIRWNFLIKNSSSMTEEERQANISLGMKKAEYAAENFIPGDKRKSFLDAMESVAKLAAAGISDANGSMDYGVKKDSYLGHGSNLAYTTDGLDMMRIMDSSAYAEYQKISKESSNADRPLNTLKFLTNWYADAVKKHPGMVDKYEEQGDKYVKEKVKEQKLDNTFADIKTNSKSAFLEGLRSFQISNPNFLSFVLKKELALQFWKN